MQTCTNCQKVLSQDQFNKRKSSKNGLMTTCKMCHRQKNKILYQNNKSQYINRSQKTQKKNLEWLQQIKKELKCVICSENKHWRLSFHHTDPKNKDFSIAGSPTKFSKTKIVEEISKCICVCHNCHADIHYNPSS